MANSLYDMHLQGISVVVFISLNWIFALTNTTTIIPCRCVLEGELAIENLTERRFVVDSHFNEAILELQH